MKQEKLISTSRNSLTKIVIALLTCAFICFCCYISIFIIAAIIAFSTVIKTNELIHSELYEVCGLEDNEIDSAYNLYFSDEYKKKTNLKEFRLFYKQNSDFFENCENTLIIENLIGGNLDIEYKKTGLDTAYLEFDMQLDNYTIQGEMTQNSNEDWKFDSLEIR